MFVMRRVLLLVGVVALLGAGSAMALTYEADERASRTPSTTDAATKGASPRPPIDERLSEAEQPDLPPPLATDPGYQCVILDYATPGPHPPDPCYRTVDGRMTTERVDPATGEPWQGPDEFAPYIRQLPGVLQR